MLDGRFPVYVVMSVRTRLEAVYGEAAAKLEAEMLALVRAMRMRRGWSGRLFLPDDPQAAAALGIRPVRSADPWELKLALADLDAALQRQGQMIGALLIVGGAQVVPFHHLPNPVDDQDLDVPSDNPYATRDENYFIPEWPVGRLPGGEGKDASLLLDLLQRITRRYQSRPSRSERLGAWRWPAGWLPKRDGFGYTAAIWQQAAAQVFQPIGAQHELWVSPPFGLAPRSSACWIDEPGSIPRMVGRLAYFNLHGLVDAAEWYGQSAPRQGPTGSGPAAPDYPVALRPQDLERLKNCIEQEQLPQIVFSEACYGAHIQGKTVEQALALKFLQVGCQALVGSTCMAYGSLGTPLSAADLLGAAFWHLVQVGMPAGEALRRAKIHLVGEMHERQGCLDGEDQKTLISFVLYGDPLGRIHGGRDIKGIQRLCEAAPRVKKVCERAMDRRQPVPAEVMAHVRQLVAHHLPGMAGAQMRVCGEAPACRRDGLPACQQCLNCTVPPMSPENGSRGQHRVIFSKQVKRGVHIHTQYARLVLDAQGQVVKFTVSK